MREASVVFTWVARRFLALRRHEGGATALEFAMVGMPFLMFIGAILEAGLLVLAQVSLDNALDRGAREVFTGTFQLASDGTDPASRLAKAMCASGPALYSCADLKVEVTVSATFASQSLTNPYNALTKSMTQGFGSRFQCPNGNDIVTIRAAATAPHMFAFADLSGRQLANGRQLVMSTLVFKAEPYANGKC